MNARTIFILLLLATLPAILFSQENTAQRERKALIKSEMQRYKSQMRHPSSVMADDQYDVTYYLLDVTITATPQYISGRVVMNAKMTAGTVDSIRLDLMRVLTVDSVFIDGTRAAFRQDAESFIIHLNRTYSAGENFSAEIFYQGVPGSSGFGSFEFSTHGSPAVPWIWSLSEPDGAKDWWPCKDHPSDKADSADVIVTCDAQFKVGSNGRLVSVVDNGNGTKTHHWHESYPITTYLISVAISNYSEVDYWFKYSPADSMPVINYVLPEHVASAQTNLPKIVNMIGIYSNLFGLYPFINEKYGHSDFGWGGGMEHQTMTSVISYDEYLIVHELAHQWFGDMITCRTWPDIWLNEGFATYCEALYAEQRYGKTSYWSQINSDGVGALNAVGTISVADTADVNYLFDGNLVYSKGAFVLHMLRHVIGDSAFFHSMAAYAGDARLRFSTASTQDFRSVCESVSGMDLGWFFNEWIHGENYPRYSMTCTAVTNAAGTSCAVSSTISQSTGTSNPSLFTMPVDLRYTATGWDTTVTFRDTVQNQIFTVTLPFTPKKIQIDAGNWILKAIDSVNYVSIPDTVDFGSVILSLKKIDTIAVGNYGFYPITVSSITSDNADFTITPTSGYFPNGATRNFSITFTPQADGMRTGVITVVHTGIPSPSRIIVRGIGVTPTLTCGISADSLRFGHRTLGAIITDTIVATNTGNGVLTVSSVTIDSGAFILTPSSAVLQPGARVSFFVTFRPTRTGPDSATIVIVHNGLNSPARVFVTGYGDPVNVAMSFQSGWNMVSIPKAVPDASVGTMFGSVLSPLFAYTDSNGYISTDTLRAGTGYWLKLPTARSIVQNGVTIISDTVNVVTGWNLIGATGVEMAAGSILTDPPDAIISHFYGYGAAYVQVDSLQPGHGYWVKVRQEGRLLFDTSASNRAVAKQGKM